MAANRPMTRPAPAKLPAQRGGGMRPLPVFSCLGDDVPITEEEIRKVLSALGAELQSIFEEDK